MQAIMDIFLYLILLHLLHCIPLEELHALSYIALLQASHNTFLKHDFLAQVISLHSYMHSLYCLQSVGPSDTAYKAESSKKLTPHVSCSTCYSSSTQSILEIKGPVLDYTCNCICDNCRQCLRNGKAPPYALASVLWLKAVPDVLSCLTYVERLWVARIRVNSCFVRIASSGLRKMASHIIAFKSPVPKIYRKLPPPMEELDEVLAILFSDLWL